MRRDGVSFVTAFGALTAGLAASLAAALPCVAARASEPELRASQVHIRSGYFGGSVKAQDYGSTLSIVGAMDLEYEVLLSGRRGAFVRATLGYDSASSRMPYSGLGAGMRYYFLGSGGRYESSSGGDRIERSPRLRAFAGPELGIAQVTVQRVGPVLNVTSTVLEVGGSIGVIRQLGGNLGIELLGAAHTGFGFANVSAASTVYRILVGVSLYL